MPKGVYDHTAFRGENSGQWKGDSASYQAKHQWVYKYFGKATRCEDLKCKKKSKSFQWANISGKYLRDHSDWKMLCRLCHKKFDAHLLARGEKSGSSKLNRFQVQRIRLIKQITPQIKQNRLAKMFGVTDKSIQNIVLRKTWKHIL